MTDFRVLMEIKATSEAKGTRLHRTRIARVRLSFFGQGIDPSDTHVLLLGLLSGGYASDAMLLRNGYLSQFQP
jgi:hypothetical protein